MYCSRPVQRSPHAIRIISQAPRRQASYFAGFPTATISPFYTRPAANFNPFAGFERLLDDITSPQFPFAPAQITRQAAYQPRFDVREHEGTYELRGEVPGIDPQNIEVEFTDPQTLVVKGRHETESTKGTPPAEQVAQSEKGKEHADATTTETAAAVDNSDAASVSSTGSYQKPSVEDATEPAAETETAATTEAQNTPTTTPGAEQVAEAPQQQSHTWISERSSGSFQRVFKFPHRVEQEAVRASLKNGILSIVVPKAAKPEVRRIQVE